MQYRFKANHITEQQYPLDEANSMDLEEIDRVAKEFVKKVNIIKTTIFSRERALTPDVRERVLNHNPEASIEYFTVNMDKRIY